MIRTVFAIEKWGPKGGSHYYAGKDQLGRPTWTRKRGKAKIYKSSTEAEAVSPDPKSFVVTIPVL